MPLIVNGLRSSSPKLKKGVEIRANPRMGRLRPTPNGAEFHVKVGRETRLGARNGLEAFLAEMITTYVEVRRKTRLNGSLLSRLSHTVSRNLP